MTATPTIQDAIDLHTCPSYIRDGIIADDCRCLEGHGSATEPEPAWMSDIVPSF